MYSVANRWGMLLLERSLHPSCIILGNINAEAVMDLLNAITFVGRFRKQLLHTMWVLRLFCSDAAAYNIKALGTHQLESESKVYELSCLILCCIHALCRSRSNVLVWFDIAGPIFCLVNLMRQATNRDHFRKKLNTYVRDKLLRFGPNTNQSARAFGEWCIFVMLLAWMADGNLGVDPQSAPPVACLKKLLRLLNGDWRNTNNIIHHCAGEGCCRDDEHCAEQIVTCICELFVDRALPSPSFKGWTNAITCLVVVMLLIVCHGILLHCGPHSGDKIAAVVVQKASSAITNDDQWHEKNRKRKNKVKAWLGRAGVAVDIMIIVCSLIPQMELHCILRAGDSDAAWMQRLAHAWDYDGSDEQIGASYENIFLDLLSPETSPVDRALRSLVQFCDTRLSLEEPLPIAAMSFPIHAKRVTDFSWEVASSVSLRMLQYFCNYEPGLRAAMPDDCIVPMRVAIVPTVASIWEKFLPYRWFPLKLGRIADPRVCDATKSDIVFEATHLEPCCLDKDMTAKLVREYRICLCKFARTPMPFGKRISILMEATLG